MNVPRRVAVGSRFEEHQRQQSRPTHGWSAGPPQPELLAQFVGVAVVREPGYQDCVRYNWRNGEALIPQGWIDEHAGVGVLVEVPNQVRMNVPTIKPWAFFAGGVCCRFR